MGRGIAEFLTELNDLGIQVWRESDQLRLSAPKGVITPELKAQIVERKTEMLSFLSAAQDFDEQQFDPILPADRTGPIPLSMTQQDIWPLIQRNPGSSAYQTAVARRLRFELDVEVLAKTLTEVTLRHEILRTIFLLQDGRPFQVVCPLDRFPLEYRDLRSVPADQRESYLVGQLSREAAVPLNPATGPLFRVVVFQVGEEDFALLQVLHYLVADCVGQAILEGEVARLYPVFAGQEGSLQAPIPVQYGDYAIWQQDQLEKGRYRSQLDYWTRVLAPPLPAPAELAGQPLDAARSSRAERSSVWLPADLTASLNTLARGQKGTLYMVLLAAFGMFLSANSQQRDLLIGTPVAARIYPGLEGAVGRFLNTLVMRLNADSAESFLTLLSRARQTVLDAFANQDAPMVQVIEALRAVHGGEQIADPLFAFQLNFAPLSDVSAEQLPPTFGEELDLELSEARYPLTLHVGQEGESIHLMFIAQEGLFPASLLDLFLRQIRILLEEIVADPERPVYDFIEAAAAIMPLPEQSAKSGLLQQENEECEWAKTPSEVLILESDPAEPVEGQPVRSTAVEQTLIDLWKRVLKIDNIDVKSNFFALGGSSLLAMRMAHELYETLGVNVPLNLIFRYPTIENIAANLQKQIGKKLWDSLVPIRPEGDRPPVYFVHGIVGDTLWFERFAHYLKPNQPVYGLQARGLDGIQQPQETIEEMARLYVQEIRRHQPAGPYYIAGYSSGGITAYEMACQLQEAGQEVGLLMVIDQANPRSDYYTFRLTPRSFVKLLENMPYRVSDFMKLPLDRIVNRIYIKVQQILRSAKWALQPSDSGARSQSINELVDYAPSLPEHIQDIIRVGHAALMNYYPRPYTGRLTLMRAKGGRLFCSHDPKMGWGNLVAGVDEWVIPGAHWGLFQDPHIRDLANAVQQCLDESQGQR